MNHKSTVINFGASIHKSQRLVSPFYQTLRCEGNMLLAKVAEAPFIVAVC